MNLLKWIQNIRKKYERLKINEMRIVTPMQIINSLNNYHPPSQISSELIFRRRNDPCMTWVWVEKVPYKLIAKWDGIYLVSTDSEFPEPTRMDDTTIFVITSSDVVYTLTATEDSVLDIIDIKMRTDV